MATRSGLLFGAVVSLLFFTTFSRAQDARVLTINTIDDTAFPNISVLVSVQEANGVSVLGLEANDFEVRLDQEVVEVESVRNVRADNLPISVVLVIDASTSMRDKPLADTIAAAQAFLENLSDGDEVALVSFGDQAALVQPFTSDLTLIRAALENIQVTPGTALYDGAALAAEIARQSRYPRRFVLLMTDGQEYGGRSVNQPETASEQAISENIAFYTVGIGFVDASYLRTLAEATGGVFYQSPDTERLTELYTYLADYLRTQYVVTLSASIEPNGEAVNMDILANNVRSSQDYIPPDLYPQAEFVDLPIEPITETTTLHYEVTAVRGLETLRGELNGTPIDIAISEGVDRFEGSLVIDPYLFDGPATLQLHATDQAQGQRVFETQVPIASLPPQIELALLADGVPIIPSDKLTVGSQTAVLQVETVRSQRPVKSIHYTIRDQSFAIGADAQATIDLLALPANVLTIIDVTVDDGEVAVVSAPSFSIAGPIENTEWTPVIKNMSGTKMALIPPGCFVMGSAEGDADERPEHETCLLRSYWLDVLPVTNADYGSAGMFPGDDRPRGQMTWERAVAYCNARGGRLPTEAEWEFAARGPSSWVFPWGSSFAAENIVYSVNSDGTTQPVGEHPRSASWVGVQDLIGNIWQWTSSAYYPYPYDVARAESDLSDDGALRVLRGGAATLEDQFLYAANRFARPAQNGYGVIGFRCAQDYTPAS